ncbi:malate synthase-like [Glandiceps talaboti]
MTEKSTYRLQQLASHIIRGSNSCNVSVTDGKLLQCNVTTSPTGHNSGQSATVSAQGILHAELQHNGVRDVEVSKPPAGFETEYKTILTGGAVSFVADLVRQFNSDVEQMLTARILCNEEYKASRKLPDFSADTRHIRESTWTVKPVPRRLINRHLDLGDVSPSNLVHFKKALNSNVQGIQVDFDDGHCPTWKNQLLGMYHIHQVIHNKYQDVPPIQHIPVLMLRPRAWNMVDHTLMVEGMQVPGPLWDFGLLMYHFGKILLDNESGPFFYLSKLEGYKEARLWNKIFTWTEQKLGLPHGCIKACVLIENILASFEMNEILYELRDHSAGLNCGIWDYCASILNKFGKRKELFLPDRNKYVDMGKHFLKSYMDLVVQTCHRRGCHATGGMAALLVPDKNSPNCDDVIKKATSGKLKEIQAGIDGFMVYDCELIEPMHQLFQQYAPSANQYAITRPDVRVTANDLLIMPKGGVTFEGLKHNIAVGVLFINAWLHGKGHFMHNGAVEDSATAEISRSQVWQCIGHQAHLEDDGRRITTLLVHQLVQEFVDRQMQTTAFVTLAERKTLHTAAEIFKEIVSKRHFPQFITTYLNLEHSFLQRMW